MSPASWKTPSYFGECADCGAVFDEGKVNATNAAMRQHELTTKHTVGWVALCGCGERFGPGNKAVMTKRLKEHHAIRDYEPLDIFEVTG